MLMLVAQTESTYSVNNDMLKTVEKEETKSTVCGEATFHVRGGEGKSRMNQMYRSPRTNSLHVRCRNLQCS